MNPAPGFKQYPQHRVETRPSSAHMLAIKERLAFYPDKFEISTPATGGK